MFLLEESLVKGMLQTLLEKSLQLKGLWVEQMPTVLQCLLNDRNTADLL